VRRLTRLLLIIAGAIAGLSPSLVVTAAAHASDVSADEFNRLVTEAADSGDTGELAEVTSIDGAPVDMTAVLDGSARDLAARLDSLSQLGDGRERFDGRVLRDQAGEILSNPPFSAEVASNSSLLGRLVEFVGRLFSGTGARGVGLLAIAGITLAAGFLTLDRLVTRRRATVAAPTTSPTPVDYRSRAEKAASTGAFAEAVRFLFVDGAHSLAAMKVVPDAATTTTATVRRLTDDDRFLERFNEIAYGGATAESDDVAQARLSWDHLKRRLEAR
jgi:hypothetical protein